MQFGIIIILSLVLFVSVLVVAPAWATIHDDLTGHFSSPEYELVWSDDFSTSSPHPQPVNPNLWDYEAGFIRNNEIQYYRNNIENVYAQNGHLVLEARNNTPVLDPDPDGKKIITTITSGSIYSKKSFIYGKFEARMKVPTGHNGTWPAFWLLGVPSNGPWPLCGEIDIMENVGFQKNILHGTIHDEKNNGWAGTQIGNETLVQGMAGRFATYQVEWTPDFVRFSVDNVSYLTFKNDKRCSSITWPFHQPFQIKLNLAIGGSWGGQHGVDPNLFPAKLEVESVRVYQQKQQQQDTKKTCKRYSYFLTLQAENSPSFDFVRDKAMRDPKFMLAFSSALDNALLNAFFPVAGKQVTGTGNTQQHDGVAYVNAISPDFYASNKNKKIKNTTFIIVNFTLVDIDPILFEQKFKHSALQRLNNKTIASSNEYQVMFKQQCGGSSSLVVQNLSSSSFYDDDGSSSSSSLSSSLPFGSFAAPVRVPAVAYDFGGPFRGYSDTTVWNQNMAGYGKPGEVDRAGLDWVDIGRDDGGDLIVGYIVPTEWLRFSRVVINNQSVIIINNNNDTTTSSKNGNDIKVCDINVTLEYANGDDAPASVDVDLLQLLDDDDDKNDKTTKPTTATIKNIRLPSTKKWTTLANSSWSSLFFPKSRAGVYRITTKFHSALVLKSFAVEASNFRFVEASSSDSSRGLKNWERDAIIAVACSVGFVAVAGVFEWCRRRRNNAQQQGVEGGNAPLFGRVHAQQYGAVSHTV